MTIHHEISSHILTSKCFSLFSRDHNKSQLLFISSSNHKHIKNMNLEVFSRVVMRLGFQKILVFSDNKIDILKKKNLEVFSRVVMRLGVIDMCFQIY